MNISQKKEAIIILKALREGWHLLDKGTEMDYLFGVNERWHELEGFYPKKEFIKSMEENGLIEDEDKRPVEQRYHCSEIEIGITWHSVAELYPLDYRHKITEKGHQLLSENV